MPFEKGKSGNPKGRPPGSRHGLAEACISDLQQDWKEHGAAVIAVVRAKEPATYMKVVASVIPKDVTLTASAGLVELLSAIGRAESSVADVSPVEESRASGICH